MPPFGTSASLEEVFDSLPPLVEASAARQPLAGRQSLFEGLDELKRASGRESSSILYRLVLLDAEGRPSAYPSEHDLARLIQGQPVAPAPPAPAAATPSVQLQQPAREPSFQELLAETHKKGGPVCSHCGATESPQWRRGPPHKAILCNACGTRFRRTNQLGSTVPSNLRKRGAAHQQQHCGSQARGHEGPAAKQPRVVA